MSDHDQPATRTTSPDPATIPAEDRPVTLPDEATGVPAHLLAALTAPAPQGTANPDPAARAELAAWARDDILEAHAHLLGELHDIDFHNWADGGMNWLYAGQPVEQVAEHALHLADRVAQAADTVRATITAATARRDWLTSGRPLRCLGCGDVIDPTTEAWRVCRSQAEHDVCHHDDPAVEDQDRAWTVEEDLDLACSEDRIRSGGPYPGDVIEVTYPDRHLPITAIWEIGPTHPHGPGLARIDTSVRVFNPDGTTRPAAGHEAADLLDLTGATGLRITWRQDAPDGEVFPGDDHGPTGGGCGDGDPAAGPG